MRFLNVHLGLLNSFNHWSHVVLLFETTYTKNGHKNESYLRFDRCNDKVISIMFRPGALALLTFYNRLHQMYDNNILRCTT